MIGRSTTHPTRLLFCASDAGGANEIRQVALEARRQGMAFSFIASPETQYLLEAVGLSPEVRQIASIAEAEQLLRAHKPDVLITGTTGAPSNGRFLTLAARRLGIPSIAVHDEWYGYIRRFKEKDALTFLPDRLCVQDELSRDSAEAEGIPAGILRVTGSPSLAFLAQQAQAFAEDPPALPEVLRNRGGRPAVLFLSDRVSRGYGSKPGERGLLGSFLGYDENTVRADLAEILSKQSRPVLLLEKLHPAESTKPSPSHAAHVEWRPVGAEEPLLPLLWYSDHIVGMTTKALLEAAFLGRKPLSYQPNALRDPSELCTAVRFGAADLSHGKDDLAKRMEQRLREGRPEAAMLDLPCADLQSAANVLAVTQEL